MWKVNEELKMNEEQVNELMSKLGYFDGVPIDGDGAIYTVKVSVQKTPTESLYRNKEWMVENYTNQFRSCADIGKQFNVSAVAIHQWLNKHNITSRPRGFKKEFLHRYGDTYDSR